MKFWCVFKKELQLYYGSFIAYALSMAFLVLAGYFFYTDMIFYDLFGDFMDITTSLWFYYFQDVRFFSLLILPLLTMRLFAEEKKLGTIELLWTYPLKDSHIILGKFPGQLFCVFPDGRRHPVLPLAAVNDPRLCLGTTPGRLSRHPAVGRGLYRLRHVYFVADREPAGQRHVDLCGAGLVVVSDLE